MHLFVGSFTACSIVNTDISIVVIYANHSEILLESPDLAPFPKADPRARFYGAAQDPGEPRDCSVTNGPLLARLCAPGTPTAANHEGAEVKTPVHFPTGLVPHNCRHQLPPLQFSSLMCLPHLTSAIY